MQEALEAEERLYEELDHNPQFVYDDQGNPLYQYDPITGVCYAEGVLYMPDGALYAVPEEALTDVRYLFV